ncbi:conserved hypothetical protein [Mycobacterium tuberculosis T17]|nr:conserved hypothetical protein [Mycobacterium tuberculosis T17]
MRHFLRLTFAGRFEGSRDDRPLLGYDTPTGLTCPYTTPLDVTPVARVSTSDLAPSQAPGLAPSRQT